MKDNLPTRKRIRLKGYNYSTEGMYYITICVKDRLEILGGIANEKDSLCASYRSSAARCCSF